MTDQLFLLCISVLNSFSHSPEGRRADPTGVVDYIIVIISVLIVIVSLYLCVTYLLSPEEEHDSHIKNSIFDDDTPAKRGGKM